MVAIEDIHIGDRVRIREWDDMAAEYIVEEGRRIAPPSGICFVLGMKKYCGKEATISKILVSWARKYAQVMFESEDTEYWGNWTFTNEMIELIDDTPPYEITDEEFFKILDGREV